MNYILILVILLFPIISGADDSQSDGFKIQPGEKVISIARWTPQEEDLQCVIIEKPQIVISESEGTPATRTLIVYKFINDKKIELYKESVVGDSILSLFQYGFHGTKLYAIWGGRRFLNTEIYSFVDGKVKKVLSVSSDGYPEVKLSDVGNKEIVVARTWKYLNDSSIVTAITYYWNDQTNRYIFYNKTKKKEKNKNP